MNIVDTKLTPDVASLFANTARKVKPKKPILIAPQPLNYGDALDQIGRLITLFANKGLRRGESVVLSIEEDAAVVPIFLACFRYGLPVTVIDIDATVGEAEDLFNLIDVKAVFVSQKVDQKWQSANLSGSDDLKLRCVIDLSAEEKSVLSSLAFWKSKPDDKQTHDDRFPAILQSLAAADAPPEEPVHDDNAVRFFTSGTTGAPNIVRLSYSAVLAQAEIMARQTQITEESVLLSLFQFTQLGGLASGILMTFWNGSTLCRPVRRFTNTDIPALLDSIYKYRVTHYYLVPAMMELFLRYSSDLRQAFDTEDFRYFLCMAATLPENLWLEFEKVTGHEVINSYGLTEANNLTYSGPRDQTRDTQSTGKAVDVRLKVIDEDGEEVQNGEAGELLVRGPTMLLDYYRNPVDTAAVLKNGWFHTGDLARMDDSGNLHINGRIKDVIISGGYNIYPEEINARLLDHPNIDQAYTLGIKADIWGEHAVSVVVANDEGLTDQAVIAHLRNHLSEFKIPKQIHFIESLPLNSRGKIDRRQIEAVLHDKHAGSSEISVSDLKSDVIEIAARSFFLDPKDLTISSAYNDTPGWDSLGHLLFIEAIQSHFGVNFEPMDILRIQTLSDVVNFVSECHDSL